MILKEVLSIVASNGGMPEDVLPITDGEVVRHTEDVIKLQVLGISTRGIALSVQPPEPPQKKQNTTKTGETKRSKNR
eukprot:2144992-Amphidinium_carterae.1